MDPSVPEAGAPAPREEREQQVLEALAREGKAVVAFQGLKRQLDVHQQVLTRTLRRLEQAGMVTQTEMGYRLTEAAFSQIPASTGPGAEGQREPLHIVDALLPPHVHTGQVVGHLAQRWFDGLHWYGLREGPGEATLIWTAAEDDGRIRVHVDDGQVGLEVEGAWNGRPSGYRAARAVLASLAELYGIRPGGGGGLDTLVEGGQRFAS